MATPGSERSRPKTCWKCCMDEDRYWPDSDPRLLLPYIGIITADEPPAERLPFAHTGTDEALWGKHAV